MRGEPESIGGFRAWAAGDERVAVRFVGRGPELSRHETLRRIEDRAPSVAWARQVHSSRCVVVEHPGESDRADGLVTTRSDLALSISTADCVPVLLAADDRIAAVHAGWRGIVGGVIAATLDDLSPTDGAQAWIGPAIGACCYEVGAEVAAQIAHVSSTEVVSRHRERPHVDLVAAVRHQLISGGVAEQLVTDVCTRCRADWLWSYRRDGDDAGRNLAFIWRR